MVRDEPRLNPQGAWAYGYAIDPAQLAERMRAVKRLLSDENAAARRESRQWSGRLVVEEQVTHILVVSDDPEQDHDINARLETALTALNVTFARTVPMEVADVTGPLPPPPAGGTDH